VCVPTITHFKLHYRSSTEIYISKNVLIFASKLNSRIRCALYAYYTHNSIIIIIIIVRTFTRAYYRSKYCTNTGIHHTHRDVFVPYRDQTRFIYILKYICYNTYVIIYVYYIIVGISGTFDNFTLNRNIITFKYYPAI